MATDENFSNVVQSGTETAAAYQAHSMYVAPYGLEPARYYWFRFKASDEISPVPRPPQSYLTNSEMNRRWGESMEPVIRRSTRTSTSPTFSRYGGT